MCRTSYPVTQPKQFFFKDLSICERERGREEESVQAGEGAEKEGERISSIF